MADVEVQDLPQTQLDGFALVEIAGALYRRPTNGFGVDPALAATVEDLSADVVQLFDDVADVREDLETKADADETATALAHLTDAVADSAADVVQVFSDVADVRGDAEALAGRVSKLEDAGTAGVMVGTVTKKIRQDGTGDFATINAGLAWFRSALRWPGAAGILDVGRGVFAEDLMHVQDEDLGWVEIAGAGIDVFDVRSLSQTGGERNFVVTAEIADASSFAVGDQVFLHHGIYGNWREIGGMGGMRVVEKGAGFVRLRCRSNTVPAFRNEAVHRLVRPRTQIRTTKTYMIDGGRSPVFSGGIAMCPAAAPTGEANYDIVRVQRGALLKTAQRTLLGAGAALPIPAPDIYVGHGVGGITVAANSRLVGDISVCGGSGRGLAVYGGTASCRVFLGCNNGDGAVADNLSAIFLDAQSNHYYVYVTGNQYAGIAALNGSELWFRGLVGTQGDAYCADNSRITGAVAGMPANEFYPSPPNRTIGNNNSYVDVF